MPLLGCAHVKKADYVCLTVAARSTNSLADGLPSTPLSCMPLDLENVSAPRGDSASGQSRRWWDWLRLNTHPSALSAVTLVGAALYLVATSSAAPQSSASIDGEQIALEGLRYVRMIRVPLRFGPIRGVRGGKVFLALKWNPHFSLGSRAPNPNDEQPLTEGDHIPGTEYQITGISPKMRKNKLGFEEDVSEITVRHIRTKKEHTIVSGKVTRSEDVYARVEVDDERKKVQVAIGSIFEFPLHSKTRYEVKEITETHRTLVNSTTGERSRLERE